METSAYINRLQRIRKLNQKDKEYTNKDLYRLLCKDVCLIEAYKSIKNNRRTLTPGVGKASLEGFGRERLDKLLLQIQTEKWQPQPARRVMIPKPGREEKRFLGVQGPEEKIVQSAVYRILEAIYEPIFEKSSYGFRPQRGCHTALKDISQKYDGISFAIEGDIKGMYDNVNHQTLISLLKKKISDERFIALIWKLLRAGCMDVNQTITKPELGTAQGSILSPMLANIYLHELDIYMKGKVTNTETGRSEIRTPVFMELAAKRKGLEAKLKAIGEGKTFENVTKEGLLKELHQLKMQSLNTRAYRDTKPRMYYHRYADDFIIGISGSRESAETLKSELGEFLQNRLNLNLSLDKTKVTDLRKVAALFLGHEIVIDTSTRLKKMHVEGKSPFLKRTTGHFVKLRAPMAKAVQRMHLKGFCDGNGKPTPKRNWISQEDNQIIELYNAVLRGWFNYYKGCHYQHRLGRMWYIMRYSCAMTLASKHKSSISKVFNKHGKDIEIKYGVTSQPKTIKLFKPDLSEKGRKFYTGKNLRDPYALIAYRTTKSRIDDACSICG